MKKIKIFLVCANLLILINISVADIAPTPNSYSGIPLPSDSTAFNKDPFSDKHHVVDVSMAAETVFVDLYPTFLKVKAVFRMRGGKTGARNLTAGFPENIVKRFASHPLYNLVISVNEKKVTPYYHADFITDSGPGTYWWLFNLDVPPERGVKVVVSYYQLLFNEYGYGKYRDSFLSGTSEFIGGYIFRTGALWKDNIGHAKIKLTTHGELDKYLTLNPTPHKSSKNIYEWNYFDWNPKNDLSMTLNFPNKYIDSVSSGIAPYNFENISPRIRFIDKLLRFSRSPILTEEKNNVLITAILDAASQDENYELKIYAHKVLEFLRNNISEYANNLNKYLDIVDRRQIDEEGVISYDFKPGDYDTDKWDDIFFRTGTIMGTYLHNITAQDALFMLTPEKAIEIDSSFTLDRLYKDGMKIFRNHSKPIDGRFSEYGTLGLVSEDLFNSLRQQNRTNIFIVIGIFTALFLMLIYFAWKFYKNKYSKK